MQMRGAQLLQGCLWLALALSALVPAPAMGGPERKASSAVVLVMVEDRGCQYCARWESEVGLSYIKSAEGKFAHLVRRNRKHPQVVALSNIIYSPTFVLLADGRELGRIVGYQGADLFWIELAPLVAKAGFRADQGTSR